MTFLWFNLALILELLATGGFIVYIIKQYKWVFQYSYWILVAGFVCHTIFIGCRYYFLEAVPVLDLKSALSFFSWSIILVYLVLQIKFRLMVLGSFVAPFAAFLMIISTVMPCVEGPVKPLFKSVWLTAHVGTVFIGNGLFAIAFMAAVMYLIQERHIKRKRLGLFYSRLPSLATLDNINYYALIYGFPFLTIGMITGSIYAQYALGIYWQWDPKEVWSLITWLFYAALLHERLAVGWQGRRAAIMSIVCFCVLIFTFVGASLWLGGYHSFDSLGAGEGLR
ncbi:MAG: c-type cytochrome biogenesis protein CcsB [Deltaproteobacteria bacterium]|nr:c-type cytochrome biogenesis protein CcsB [Deltaproteobacteria bacterium]MBW2117178.1 c-type cytochrome biogenesis protein CcsB [Deltaproteobacteria bacterium]MBW2343663.1 c-type cytochrome biogenesis protein CcsB [Deltaproteobacteria bacterium]